MKARWLLILVALPLTLLLKGCGGGKAKEDTQGLKEEEITSAKAVKASYHDWESIELRNGLVKVAIVPRLGGRVIGYDFGDRALLYANPKLYGRSPGVDPGNHKPWAPGTAEQGKDAAEPATSDQPTDSVTSTDEAHPKLGVPSDHATVKDVPGGGEHSGDGPLAAPAKADKPAKSDPTARPAGAPRTSSEGAGTIGDSTSKAPMPAGSEVGGDPAKGGEPWRYTPSQTSEKYTNYGGQVLWPAPQAHWSAPWPPPAGLDLGTWTDKLERTDGDTVEVRLDSPKDEGLGLELSKTVSLPRASTVLRIVSSLRNIGQRTRTWSLSDVSQHPGALAPGETFTKDINVFLPLDPQSKRPVGFASLLGPATNPQYAADNGILKVEYLGREGLIGTDDRRGWAVWADRRHDTVVAKLAALDPKGTYPDGNLPTTVYTAPSESESYVQLVLRAPLTEVAPNDSLAFTVWYGAATCPVPIVSATPAGVVNTPLKAERIGDSVHLSGVFGVFYTGHAQVSFFDKAGFMLARTQPVPVSPLQTYKLDTLATLPDGTVRAALVITNSRRVDVGELSDCGLTQPKPSETQPELAAAGGVGQGGKPTKPGELPPVSITGEGPAPTGATMPAAGEPAKSTPSGTAAAGQQPPALDDRPAPAKPSPAP